VQGFYQDVRGFFAISSYFIFWLKKNPDAGFIITSALVIFFRLWGFLPETQLSVWALIMV